MAEIISAWISLAHIALLMCLFIPTATYMLNRLRVYHRNRKHTFRLADIPIFLVAIGLLWLMIALFADAEHLRPRCAALNSAHMECAQQRGDTSTSILLPREQAEAWMRADSVRDAALCLVVPAIVGVGMSSAVVWMIRWQTRTRDESKNIS